MTNLLINIDHVATLRNARRERIPDPVEAAAMCEDAGADGIVFHLREDRRHIMDDDVVRLKERVRGKLDFELSLAPEIVDICRRTRPDLATLVPERRQEITTEGGLDARRHRVRLQTAIAQLFDAGVGEVAIFIESDLRQIEAARDVGASAIELHTGDFALAREPAEQARQAARLALAAKAAHEMGLRVHAGHGLDYDNYPLFASETPFVAEVSIGFAVIARAVLVGLDTAVREMRRLVKGRDAA